MYCISLEWFRHDARTPQRHGRNRTHVKEMVLTIHNTRSMLNHHVRVFKRHARFHKLPDRSSKPTHAHSQLVSPVIGEQATGENKPTFLVAFDVVGPLEEPAPKLFRRLSLHFVACLRGRHDTDMTTLTHRSVHVRDRPRARKCPEE